MSAPSLKRFATTRRSFLSQSSVAIVGLVALPLGLAGCKGRVPPMVVEATPANLSAWRFQTLAAVSERIIPQTDTPGAIGAGVPQYIDGMLVSWAKPETRELLEASLDMIDTTAQETHGKDFLELGQAEQIAVLEAHESICFAPEALAEAKAEAEAKPPKSASIDPRVGYRELKKLIYRGYYHSEIGCTQELQYQLVPGPDARIDAPLAEIGRSWAL